MTSEELRADRAAKRAAWRAANPDKQKAAERRQDDRRRGRKLNPRKRTSEQILRQNLRTKYGITLEQYEAMAEAQGGVCKLCGKPPSRRNAQTSRLAVDHCHETGRIRGLLCYRCNTAVAALGDDLESAMRLVAYMEVPGAILS